MKYIFTILFLVIISNLSAGEPKEFILKDSSVVSGTITEEVPGDHYKIRTKYGTLLKIEISNIAKIIPLSEKFNPEYFEIGTTALIPGIVNLNLGYTYNEFGIMLTGGPYGVELAFPFKIRHTKDISHEIVIPLGAYSYEAEWIYSGALYKLWLKGFQLLAGLTIGEGAYTNPQIYLNVGYVFRFN